ncbi:MAG TPA: TIM barrel protein [Chthoniobacterales bacterium]
MRYPKLHNAMWPGLVGKGPGSEPFIDLDTMLDLTAQAEVDGHRFDGVDLFVADPHISIDASPDDIARLAEKLVQRSLVAGSLVAPVWPPTGGGSAMGSADERRKFLTQVRKACAFGQALRSFGVRPSGVVRIDTATDPGTWAADSLATKKLVETLREACAIAADHNERLAAEGEICWGGLHSWKKAVQLLEAVDRPSQLGFQADMAHTLLYTLGANAEEDRILPSGYDWKDPQVLQEALQAMTRALRPWTIDFHVAQNDATVKGAGSHDKTGRHCLPDDPNGKLDVVRDAAHWLRQENGELTKAFRHICWDGCMFPNEVMLKPETWQSVLAAMLAVQHAHGWNEGSPAKTRQDSLAPAQP